MQAGAFVGRVGALAVALGVGAATVTGVAWAGTEGSDSADTSSVSSTKPGSAPGGATDSTKKGPKKPKAGGVDKPGAKADKPDKADKAGTPKKADKPDKATKADKAGQSEAKDADQPAGGKPTAESSATGVTADKPAADKPAADKPAADPPPAEKPAANTPVEPAATEQPEAPVVEPPAEGSVLNPAEPEPPAATEKPAIVEKRAKKTWSKTEKVTATPMQTAPQAPKATAKLADGPADTTAQQPVEKSLVTLGSVDPVTTTVAVTTSAPTTLARVSTTVPEVAKPKPSLGGAIQSMVTGVQKLVSGMLGAIGINTTSAGSPPAPTGIGALVMGLLGWGARRDFGQTALTTAPTATAAELTVSPMAATAVSPTSWVGWVTGPNSINNTLARFGFYGTDLGIMWDNGVTGDDPNTSIVEQRQILMAFGDTFSNAAMTQNWRNNILLRSADNVLSDGIYVPNGIVDRPGIPDGAYSGSPMSLTIANYAREIIGKYPYTKSTQVTIIPTGAISVPGAGVNGATRQYVAFMSIKQWGSPGSWTTNYAAISYSDDNGQNWTTVPKSSVRAPAYGRSTVSYKSGNQNFQMVSFVRPPEGSADDAAGYVYATGTPSGRNGTVYLSRVKEANILDVSKYEYWDGKKWVNNKPSAAKPILPGTTTGSWFFKKTTYPTAGELSVQYNTYLNKYVMLYTDKSNNVVMRTADSMNGTWSSGTTLATSAQYPGLYAPMIHPWSGTNQLRAADGSAENPAYLYWNMSLWGDYNVALMKTDLSQLGLTYV